MQYSKENALFSKTEAGLLSAASILLSAKLIVIGSCRGPADQARIDALKEKVLDLGLQVNRLHLNMQEYTLKNIQHSMETLSSFSSCISRRENLLYALQPLSANIPVPFKMPFTLCHVIQGETPMRIFNCSFSQATACAVLKETLQKISSTRFQMAISPGS